MVGGDYNRIPVVFQNPDIYRIAGDVTTATMKTYGEYV